MKLEEYWDFTKPHNPNDYWLEMPGYDPFGSSLYLTKKKEGRRAFRVLRYFWKRKLKEAKKYFFSQKNQERTT